MTAPDFDEPKMIYTGPLPAHLLRQRDELEPAPSAGAPDAGWRRGAPVLAISVAAAVALVSGIAIGAFLPPLLHPAQVQARTAPHGELRPAILQPAEGPAVAPAEELTAPAEPRLPASNVVGAPAPRAAVAILAPPHPVASASRQKADRAGPNPCAGLASAADRAVCADPTVASADEDLKRAYEHAQAVGAPAESLRADEIDWLLFRNDAARRSPADLALAYRQRIDQLNRLANEPPH